jgi:Zn-dependent protease with chaperone function
MSVAPITLYTVARIVGGVFGSAGTLIAIACYLAFVLLLWPSLLVRILPTRAPSSDLDARFRRLCDHQHTRIRGVRILEGRATKMANAMLLGVGRFRYVLVTDYLIDHLEPDSLDAVILHEVAHAKQHHLLKKLGSALAAIAVVEIVLAVVVALLHLPAGVVTIGFVVGLPASFLLANGWLGIRLETKADDFAAEVVGPDALRRALDCLAELNMTKRRSGPVWNLLTQHPGIQQRIDRLAARETRADVDLRGNHRADEAVATHARS